MFYVVKRFFAIKICIFLNSFGTLQILLELTLLTRSFIVCVIAITILEIVTFLYHLLLVFIWQYFLLVVRN